MNYPKDRPPYYANKLIRLLQKSCAANEIGIEACWLVTCIALVEDSKRYSGPVTFWTGQLLPITGFNSWGRLDRARERAIDAGWLHYNGGTNRKCGAYWTSIPQHVLTAFDDNPVDEVNHQNGDSHKVNHQNGDQNGDRNVIETGLKRDNAVNLLPVPFPVPSYSPGSEIQIPESMNTPEIIIIVGKWFQHLINKEKPEKVPDPNSPQEESFWQSIAKLGPERFKAAAMKSMAEGWVTLREDRVNGNGKTNGHDFSPEFLKAYDVFRKHTGGDKIQIRKELLGPILYEAGKRTTSAQFQSADSSHAQWTVAKIFEQHLADVKKEAGG